VSFAEYLTERQAPELPEGLLLFLQACANYEPLRSEITLKGGLLCCLQWGTGRATQDADFTAPSFKPADGADEARERIRQQLNTALIAYGPLQERYYSKVSSVKLQTNRRPLRADVRIHLLSRDAPQEALEKFHKGWRAEEWSTMLEVDVAFADERIGPAAVLILPDGSSLPAYSPEEQMAEKLRALLIEERKSNRCQDIFDVFRIARHHAYDKAVLLSLLRAKVHQRKPEFRLHSESMTVEVLARQKAGYEELRADVVGRPLPAFDVIATYIVVMYQGLPWDSDDALESANDG